MERWGGGVKGGMRGEERERRRRMEGTGEIKAVVRERCRRGRRETWMRGRRSKGSPEP